MRLIFSMRSCVWRTHVSVFLRRLRARANFSAYTPTVPCSISALHFSSSAVSVNLYH
jgi:hypothetical protein